MDNYIMWMKKAIANNEFADCFLGIGKYQSCDRYNSSPIAYDERLLELYAIIKEDNNLEAFQMFEDLIISICNDVEGIYIATIYIYKLLFHLNKGICDLSFDTSKLVDTLTGAIQNNLNLLKNTNEIKRLFVDYNVFDFISSLSKACYRDNGISFIKSENDKPFYQLNFTKNIVAEIEKNILDGVKIPHSVSQPVIYLENEKYYLSVFVFFYDRTDIEEGRIGRPTLWALADLTTGEILEKRDTKIIDFSDADYDIKYNVRADGVYDTSKEYYEKAFNLLDETRSELLASGVFNKDKYGQYLNMIIANIPQEYKRFYLDLSLKLLNI